MMFVCVFCSREQANLYDLSNIFCAIFVDIKRRGQCVRKLIFSVVTFSLFYNLDITKSFIFFYIMKI